MRYCNKHFLTDDERYLLKAAYDGDLKRVIELVSQGVDFHFADEFVLTSACKGNHLDIVKYLTEKGANLNADGVMDVVCSYSKLEILIYLIENGADKSIDNNIGLISASWHGRLEIVEYLLKLGVDVHARNDYALVRAIDGFFSLHRDKENLRHGIEHALRYKYLSVVNFLLSYGIDANNSYAILSCCENNWIEALSLLITGGANINKIHGEHLLKSCASNNLDIVKLLVEKGVDISVNNYLALNTAINTGRIEIVKYLFEKIIEKMTEKKKNNIS